MSGNGWTVCNMCGHQWPSRSINYVHVCPQRTQSAPPIWSTTPPTEPGKWFWRFVGDTETHVIELDEEDEGYPFEFEGRPREWWPVRLPEPPREEGE